MSRALVVALVVAVALAGCADLPEVEVGTCGNGVVEPELGEDCDRADPSCGAPDDAAACRLRCDEAGGGATCPAGAVCGLDDVCHVPAQQFSVSANLRWTSPELLFADHTDDGFPELIGFGGTQMEVHRGGGDAGYGDVIRAPNLEVSSAPRASDLDGDSILDLVLPVRVGLFALVGNPLAVLQPVFQTSFPLPTVGALQIRSIPVEADGVLLSESLIILRIAQGADCVQPEGCQVVLLGDGAAAFPPDRQIEQLAPAGLAWAYQPGLSPTAVFVSLAFVDDPVTEAIDEGGVFGYVGDLAGGTLVALGELDVPGIVLDGSWLVDIEGDGAADLVSSIDVPFLAPATVVQWGRGNGTFEAAQTLLGGGGPALPGSPLAWVDVDQDGDADLISTVGVVLASCAGRTCVYDGFGVDVYDWRDVVAHDFNGDGRVDLAGHGANASTIELMLGTTLPTVFNDASIVAAGEIVAMRAGDYDGNGMGDVAFVTRLPDADASDELWVAFGRRDAPPAPPSYVGHVGALLAIDNAMAPVPGQVDIVDDLVLLADRGGVRGGTLILGSTSQRMTAPLIPLQDDDVDAITEHVVTLPLDDVGGDDVVALVSAYPQFGEYHGQLRAYTSDAYGGLTEGTTPDQLALDHDEQILLPGGQWVGVPGDTPRVVGGDLFGRVVAIDVACAGGACTTGAPEPLTADPLGATLALITADLDADGDHDLIGAFASGVRVWRAAGGFGDAEAIEPPAGQVVVDVASVDLDVDGIPELLLVTRDDPQDDALTVGGIWLARAADGGGWDAIVPYDALAFAGADVTAGLALRALDVTGDGLVDLALMSGADRRSPQTLVVAVQHEVRPGEVVVQSP